MGAYVGSHLLGVCSDCAVEEGDASVRTSRAEEAGARATTMSMLLNTWTEARVTRRNNSSNRWRTFVSPSRPDSSLSRMTASASKEIFGSHGEAGECHGWEEE